MTDHRFSSETSTGTQQFFSYRSNAVITFFLYSEYRPISIAELKTIAENENIARVRKTSVEYGDCMLPYGKQWILLYESVLGEE